MQGRIFRSAVGQIELSTRSSARPAFQSGFSAGTSQLFRRNFSRTQLWRAVQPYILADIGEGITECQINSWSVKPGDHVQQFDPICEVQSDKATVEITSRYDGIIKSLHYEQDDIAIVGKPLLDIDVADNEQASPEESTTSTVESAEASEGIFRGQSDASEAESVINSDPTATSSPQPTTQEPDHAPRTKNSSPITPAVRHLLKLNGMDGQDVEGTGKGGRITKEDVQRHISEGAQTPEETPSVVETTGSETPPPQALSEDTVATLSPIESNMFQSMTQSLSIPHFLYTHTVDITSLHQLRRRTNESASYFAPSGKLSSLPFILKAVSLAFSKYPKMNAHLDTTTNPSKPQLIMRSSHNFGIAVDTPNGLVVPVVKNVHAHSIITLADEIKRLGDLAQKGRLAPDDFKGATFTVSNIGSIGGGVVAPVIVPPMVGIVAVGRAQQIPLFVTDEHDMDQIVKRDQVSLSWSADHRVLDGATVARVGELVGELLKDVNSWGLSLR